VRNALQLLMKWPTSSFAISPHFAALLVVMSPGDIPLQSHGVSPETNPSISAPLSIGTLNRKETLVLSRSNNAKGFNGPLCAAKPSLDQVDDRCP
ncbi:hypothetical protein, partial [Pseudomonas sp. RGM 3321]|uniref:hypothetical protein n=1 Tax=Pseudomonas sp. RGM 3321 TaxID=2930089 RepID=UPI001FCC338A